MQAVKQTSFTLYNSKNGKNKIKKPPEVGTSLHFAQFITTRSRTENIVLYIDVANRLSWIFPRIY